MVWRRGARYPKSAAILRHGEAKTLPNGRLPFSEIRSPFPFKTVSCHSRAFSIPPVHHLPYCSQGVRDKGRWALMSEPGIQETNEVSDSWQQAVQAVLGVVLVAGAVAMFHYYAPVAPQMPQPDELHKQVQQLSQEVAALEQQQAATIRARVSGTGFLVGDGLLATNRHVAEPWYGDAEAEALIQKGARGTLESLVVFFPGSPTPVSLSPGAVSSTSDLGVLKIEDKATVRGIAVLPLANGPALPGELVTVIGYPMGIAGMVAKSPNGIYQRMAYRHNDITAASELAALSLIRPSTTCGHLGDVVGDKLIYDAPTAHGGSGGPVFNSNAEVIGVNSAYIDGFSGGTLGVSVQALRPLIEAVGKKP